jgi:hypothetical protein
MATNQKFDRAESLSLPVPSGTASGVAVLVGALCGTTRTKEADGGNATGFASVDLVGAYEQTVAGALKPGQAIYMIGTPDANGLLAGGLTATSTSNTLWGYSLTTKGSGSGLATVRPARI